MLRGPARGPAATALRHVYGASEAPIGVCRAEVPLVAVTVEPVGIDRVLPLLRWRVRARERIGPLTRVRGTGVVVLGVRELDTALRCAGHGRQDRRAALRALTADNSGQRPAYGSVGEQETAISPWFAVEPNVVRRPSLSFEVCATSVCLLTSLDRPHVGDRDPANRDVVVAAPHAPSFGYPFYREAALLHGSPAVAGGVGEARGHRRCRIDACGSDGSQAWASCLDLEMDRDR